MSNKTFNAVWVNKEVCRDRLNEGCDTNRTCIVDHKCDVSAATLPALLKDLAEQWGYDSNYWGLHGEEGIIERVEFNQHEDAGGNVLTGPEALKMMEKHEPVYLADYSFNIEFRETEGVSVVCVNDLGDFEIDNNVYELSL